MNYGWMARPRRGWIIVSVLPLALSPDKAATASSLSLFASILAAESAPPPSDKPLGLHIVLAR